MELDVHPRLVRPGDGEVLNDAETRWTEILCNTPELVVSLFRRGAGVDGPELHVHRTHADAFYVLEGALVVPLGPDAEPEHVPAAEERDDELGHVAEDLRPPRLRVVQHLTLAWPD
ncbi:MAG TPA: hypothetical protein VNT58_09235 [Gaiellaceae bacterium]|nr:hypothetical protein [Gaiellaceae bacterium]